MRVAISGATGFIGRRLVRHLLGRGHEVLALTRDVARARALLPVRCACAAWAPAAALDPGTLSGLDAVVHLAGESVAGGRWSASRKTMIRDSRVLGTRSIVRALATLGAGDRPRIFVAASAIGYYGDRGDTELDERSSPGAGFLADVCRAWEDETKKAEALGLRTVAVRVGLVLGREGGALRTMLPPFRLGLGGRLGSGRQWMSWIHLDDLVALFTAALENERAEGVLNGVAPGPVPNATFTAVLARTLGRPALLPAPALALRLALGEAATLLLASQRVVPRAPAQLGFEFRYPRLEVALASLWRDPAEEIEFEQLVDGSPTEVFAFFSDARNLERITPGFLRFRVLGTSTPDLGAGTRIDYRLSLHGIPVRWQSRIDVWEPGRRFVDSQTRGPYRRWEHTHEFEPCASGTLIRDRVRYEVPLGALGALVAGRLVARDLDAIFAYRRRTIAELFG